MKRLLYLVLMMAGLASTAWAQSLVPEGAIFTADPHPPLEVVQYTGSVCYLVTFEGGEHLNQIHPETEGLVPGTPIRFGPEWITLTSGPYENNPSVPTIAIFGGNTAGIIFEMPVARLSFFYASGTPVTIEAFDNSGSLLESVTRAANYQPDDGFSLWEELSVDAGGNFISFALVYGTHFGTGIDDFTACQESVHEAEIDLYPDNYPNETDPYNTNSGRPVDLGVFSTLDFDATTIDPATAFLNDPELNGIVWARAAVAEDLNGDGLLDLVINFGVARDFDTAGALDANSTSVDLTAFTFDGDLVIGEDSIRIVGSGN